MKASAPVTTASESFDFQIAPNGATIPVKEAAQKSSKDQTMTTAQQDQLAEKELQSMGGDNASNLFAEHREGDPAENMQKAAQR